MNSCQVNLSAIEVAKAFVARFYVEAQTSKNALYNGFTHIARVVSYNPSSPFSVYERGIPFAAEDEAHDYCKTMRSSAIDRIAKFTAEDHKHYADVMLSEENGSYRLHHTYDALLIAYYPVFVACFNSLPEPSVNVDKFVDHYTSDTSQYRLTTDPYILWVKIWSEHDTLPSCERAWNQRVKAIKKKRLKL